ncbi:MAG: hypothetical protein RDU89_02425 [bacterium]|nr:hypothetical protein [bacterium]
MKGWVRTAFVIYFAVMLFILSAPWTFNLFINRLDPWVGPFPWSIFSVFLFTFMSCIGLAIYQTLDIQQ